MSNMFNNNGSMIHLFNLFNEISLVNNDVYEQNIINNAIQQSLLESNPIKNILSEEGEKELKKVVYQDRKFPMKECPITLLQFKENEEVTQLPCNHIFDTSGILWWLKTEQASCPVCRTKLKSKEISTREDDNTNNNITNPNAPLQTNPLTLFSNITIDLSLNRDLLQPYNRNYNLQPFETLLGSIQEFTDEDSSENEPSEEDDDLFFFNTLQLMQDPDAFMSNFQHIFTDSSNNNVV